MCTFTPETSWNPISTLAILQTVPQRVYWSPSPLNVLKFFCAISFSFEVGEVFPFSHFSFGAGTLMNDMSRLVLGFVELPGLGGAPFFSCELCALPWSLCRGRTFVLVFLWDRMDITLTSGNQCRALS